MEKKYFECLNETYDMFKAQGVSVLGKGFEEVMSSPVLFEQYVNSLTEGCGSDSKAQIAQLMANTNAHILTEGSVAGIAPISSLSGPVIRKLWPSFALKNAVKTEVAKSPSFMIRFTKPYYITVDGNGKEVKHFVPRPGLINGSNTWEDQDLAANYITKEQAVTGSYTFDFSSDCNVTGTGSRIKYLPLDNDFTLVSIKPGVSADTSGASPVITYGAEEIINKKVGIERVIVYDYAYPAYNDGTSDQLAGTATILVRLNAEAMTASVSVIGGPSIGLKIKVRAHRSVEYNEISTSWSFDIAREDILIGTGDHMNAPLTVESLTDMKALYQIDGMKEAVNLMTQAMNARVDSQIFKFIKESFLQQPGVGEFNSYPSAAQYLAIFDVKPQVGFAGGPKAWREELKPVFDHLAARIKNQTFLGQGVFNIVANPLDAMLITNVDWSFRGGQQNVDGVSVNYSLGTFNGSSYVYKIVSSEMVPQGVMYLVFIPEDDSQITYNYWAYTFSTELGYRDPNRANVPSVMLCKRDVMKSFLPAIAAVKIQNNDAGAAYDPFRDVLPMVTTVAESASGNANPGSIVG